MESTTSMPTNRKSMPKRMKKTSRKNRYSKVMCKWIILLPTKQRPLERGEGKKQTSTTIIIISRSVSNYCFINFNADDNIIKDTEKLGFPLHYIQMCLKDNANNHCTTTYYLLCMDQNFWVISLDFKTNTQFNIMI